MGEFEKGKIYTTNEGWELACYEITKEYIFMCPINEETKSLNIANTSVFSTVNATDFLKEFN